MNAFNYLVLIIGLALIGIFWNVISPKDRRKETLVVTIGFFVLGLVVYFLQSTFV